MYDVLRTPGLKFLNKSAWVAMVKRQMANDLHGTGVGPRQPARLPCFTVSKLPFSLHSVCV